MASPHPPRRDAGFTLIEMLVALFIFAIISTAGVSMLIVALNGKERLETEAAFLREFVAARAALSADLAQATPRPVRDAYGGADPTVFRGGFEQAGGPLLAFVRVGWDNPGAAEARGGLQHVEYLLQGDDLVRRVRARPDPTLDTPVLDRVVLSGVSNVDIQFREAGAEQPAFERALGDRGQALPDLVIVEMDVAAVGRVRQVFRVGAGGV